MNMFKVTTLKLDRIFSQEIPSDVTVRAGGTSFALHKVQSQHQLFYIPDLIDLESPLV